jgi:hypothetical protein
MRGPRLGLIADTDSRWKWGAATVASLGADEPVVALQIDTPARPSPRQLIEAGVRPDQVLPLRWEALAADVERARCDALVLALPGGTCQVALHALAAHSWTGRRPVTVAGYVGVIYQKLVEGLALRAGADMVLANSPFDSARFRRVFGALGVDAGSVMETRLPFVSAIERVPGEPFTVTFAAQPDVPPTRADRAYVVARLTSHALTHPERQVFLKVRGIPGERLTHPEPYHYADLARRASAARIPNFHLLAGPMSHALAHTDLLVTVSSTAAVEAIHCDRGVAILTDFGVREDLGVPYFLDSGCLCSFDQVDSGATPHALPGWRAHQGLTGPAPAPTVADRLTDLLNRDLPPIRPYYSSQTAPAYLDRLERSHAHPSPGRRAVARAARTVLDLGASKVVPALRSLGA